MRDQYMRISEGFLLCFSLTNQSSFEEITNIRDQILRSKDVETFQGVLVGTKSDLIDEICVKHEDIVKLSTNFSIPYIETSAKTGINVEDAFLVLLGEMDKKRKIDESKQTNLKPIIDKNKEKKGGCIIS